MRYFSVKEIAQDYNLKRETIWKWIQKGRLPATKEVIRLMDELVFIEPAKTNAVPFTTSEVIAEYSGNKHHAIQVLIDKYKDDFQEFGKVSFEMRPLPESKTGQSVKIYHLNEEQATLLLTYLKNTPQVRSFKKELVRQFYAMRLEYLKLQAEKQTPGWMQARLNCKTSRRATMDTVKAFVEYAKRQGSKNAERYYANLTRKTNSLMGISPGQRDNIPSEKLWRLSMVEEVISVALIREMNAGTEYHQAYQNAIQAAEQFARPSGGRR